MFSDPSRPSLASHFLPIGTMYDLIGMRERESEREKKNNNKLMKERKKRKCKPVDATVRRVTVTIVLACPEILSSFHGINDYFLYLNYELIPMVQHFKKEKWLIT